MRRSYWHVLDGEDDRLMLTRRTLLFATPVVAGASDWNRLRPFGRTGLSVAKLGLGAEAIKEPELIERALDLGINYFHALNNHDVVGRGIRAVRSRVVLAAGSDKPTPDEMLKHLDEQLKAFGTPYIDVWYLLSKYRPEFLTDDLMDAVRKARDAGKIRACATAGHGFGSVKQRLREVKDVVGASMVVCNFATWEIPVPDPLAKPRTSLPGGSKEDIIEMHREGLGIAAMKPLMGGLHFIPDPQKDWAKAITDRPAALAAALKWAVANPHLDVVACMASDREQLESNVRAAQSAFGDRDRKLLAGAMAQFGGEYCRMCYGCQGTCRKGVAVPDVLRALMYAEGYRDLRRGRSTFAALPERARRVGCEDCASCAVECRAGSDVRPRLIRARDLLS